MRTVLILGLVTLLAACGGNAPSSTAPSSTSTMARKATEPAHKVVDTPAGRVLASNRGMTLYTFVQDTVAGISMCNDQCAANWPPLIALDDAMPSGRWTVVQRADGLKQWAYDGKPLYGWREDKRPG